MANGRIVTGFSKPYVALYTVTGTTVTYKSGRVLARGVEVKLNPESSDDNNFYADNVAAESDSGSFTGGTVDLTVDGLLQDAEDLIYGLPEAGTDGWTGFGDDQAVPYVGIGYITRWESGGVVSYEPTVIAKCKFSAKEDAAATQEESKDYQSQSLSASMFRGDDSNHNWKYRGTEVSTEAEAETALQKKLGITA